MEGPRCLICTEKFPYAADHLVTWCGHVWCKACVNRRVRAACENEELYPPKCCQQIEFGQVRGLLDEDLLILYTRKHDEYSSTTRLYCHNITCQEFLQPGSTDLNKVHCSKCGLDTCSRCNRKAHDGVCPSDLEHETFIEAVSRAGFQQCSTCKCTVEKVTGCDHITCRCGFQFCYKCGLGWKTCHCPPTEDYAADLDEMVMDPLAEREILQLPLQAEDQRRHFQWRYPGRGIIRTEVVRNRAAARAELLTRGTEEYGGARDITPTFAGFGPWDDDADENLTAAAPPNLWHQQSALDPIPQSNHQRYVGEPPSLNPWHQHHALDPPPLPDHRQYGREPLPRLHLPPAGPGNAYLPLRYDNHIGQLPRREAFYIPDPNRHPVVPQADYEIPNNIHPVWDRLNAHRLVPRGPAANHYQRVDCTQGTRRVGEGDLTCNVCAKGMPHFIWRCMGCGFQECERCRGPRPRLVLAGRGMAASANYERAGSR